MKKQLNGFTLIELVIAVSVIALVITGLSASMLQISNHYHLTQRQMEVYSEVKDFLLDTENLDTSSGMIISQSNRYDTLFFAQASGGILVGVFRNSSTGNSFSLTPDSTVYGRDVVGIFEVTNAQKNAILLSPSVVYSYSLTKGKLYHNLLIYQFTLQNPTAFNVFEMHGKYLLDYFPDFDSLKKDQISFPKDSYLSLPFYF